MTDQELANDRTFLAWLRTGIATMGLGFVVAKVALILQPTSETTKHQGLYAVVGIAFVLCGAALVIVGFLLHKAVLDHLRAGTTDPRPRWPMVITGTATAAALVLSWLIAVST